VVPTVDVSDHQRSRRPLDELDRILELGGILIRTLLPELDEREVVTALRDNRILRMRGRVLIDRVEVAATAAN
jgi:hypothetical protein